MSKRRAFSAKQSLIVPPDVNADDRFDLADRRVAKNSGAFGFCGRQRKNIWNLLNDLDKIMGVIS